MSKKDHEQTEIELLLVGLRQRYGYDFTQYAPSSLHRRLQKACADEGVTRYTQLLDLLFHDANAFDRFLGYLSITVTEMFRDPPFYRCLRETIIPALKTYPYIKIWLAGCATGEEAYSMAMLLHEEAFLDRARIYATDFNMHSLTRAQHGVYAANLIESYAQNYYIAGGRRSFADYYSTGYDFAKMKDFLKERITFSCHNLVTDGVFGEMNLILCRNVLIYFSHALQERTLQLFDQSLRHGGFLCLGAKETLKFTTLQPHFTAIDARQKIYRKHTEAYAAAS